MQIPSFSEEKLIELAKLTGGAALLVAIAVVLSSGSFSRDSGLAAAVVMADQDFGSSHLHLEAASDTVAPGGATALTWSATNITNQTSAISCFGNGITCGAIFQTIPQSNPGSIYVNGTKSFSVGSDSYLLVSNGRYPTYPGGSARLYKWLPSLNCFGKDTASSCGTIFQTLISSNRVSSMEIFTVSSDIYFVVRWSSNSTSQEEGYISVYKWMPPGTPTVAANPNGCIGNGTVCSAALNTSSVFVGLNDIAVFSVGTDFYLGRVIYNIGSAGNYVNIQKWIPAQQCFGNATGTCGSVFQNITGRAVAGVNSFTYGSDTYFSVIALTNPVAANKNGCDNVSLMNFCIYKWMPPGTPTVAANPNGCFGTGSTCSTAFWRANYPIGHSPFSMATGEVVFLSQRNTSPYRGLDKWMPVGVPSSNTTGCLGNGSTCGTVLQNLTQDDFALTTFLVGTSTYVARAINPVTLNKWMPPGTPTVAANPNGCVGNGTTCGLTVWTYNPGAVLVRNVELFNISPNVYLTVALSSSEARVFKATASATTPACSVLWSNTGGSSGMLANTNSGTNVSTGVLMENTIYTLDCVGVGSVPITVRVVNLPTVGISAPSSVVYGSSVNVSATFTAGSGDTLTYTAINGPAPTPVPGGYNWMLAPGLSWTPPTDKIFVFDPQALGLSAGSSYTFIPDVYTQAYPNWDHSNNQSVVVSVMCTTGYAGSTCNQCAAGYAFDSTSQCKPFSCFDSGACSCSAGYTWNGSQCALAASAPTITSFSATRVRKGNAPTLTWTVTGMTSGMGCTITPAPPAGQPTWPGTSSWIGSALGISITAPTKFTLQCGSAVGGYSTQSTTAQLIPVFQEI